MVMFMFPVLRQEARQYLSVVMSQLSERRMAMANSGGHITAPVSFFDVNTVLGASYTDLFMMCTSNNINMWSAYKPIYSNKKEVLTDADYSGGAHTKSGYKTGGGILKITKTGSTYKSDIGTDGNVSNAVWSWDKPVNDGVCFVRLTDFNNYYHGASAIFRITRIFGNVSYLMLPSSDSETGTNVSFAMSFVNGQMTPSKLFGDCWDFYPSVIISSGGSDKLNYVKSAPSHISAYTGSSGVTINVSTRIFMDKMKSAWSSLHSGDAYQNFPFRTGDKWTATMVLINKYFDGGENDGFFSLSGSENIVRLEYESPSASTNVDRKTLPVKQSKYTNIEWMKMNITITRVSVSGDTSVYNLSSLTVTAKMLSTDSFSFQIGAQLSTPQGTVNVQGVASGQSVDIENYSNVTFSGTVGEVTKTISINQTTYTNTASTIGNKLCNGTLIFKNTKGNFSGTFSFDISGGAYSYTKEINLL